MFKSLQENLLYPELVQMVTMKSLRPQPTKRPRCWDHNAAPSTWINHPLQQFCNPPMTWGRTAWPSRGADRDRLERWVGSEESMTSQPLASETQGLVHCSWSTEIGVPLDRSLLLHSLAMMSALVNLMMMCSLKTTGHPPKRLFHGMSSLHQTHSPLPPTFPSAHYRSGTMLLHGELNTEGIQAVVSLSQLKCGRPSLSLQVAFSDLPHIWYLQS